MELYHEIKKQRKTLVAPVDTMGCAATRSGLAERTRRFHILVGLLLSSQTKDEYTHGAVCNLAEALGELTPEAVAAARPETIRAAIAKVGFAAKKTEYLLGIASRLSGAQAPASLEEALALPGIGKKMAYLYVQHALGRVDGIGVDTHVHRIANRIGLCRTKNPEETRTELEGRLPREEWAEINGVLVGFGQAVCTARSPKCASCCVRRECPSSTARCASED